MRKTKIICTLGPATDREGVLRQLAQSGMDVARLNFSHGTHAEQKRRVDAVKAIREELGLPLALLLDTKGPEIRLKEFKEPKVFLKAGDKFTLTTREVEGDETIASITFAGLPDDVTPGTRILIDDGLIEMIVETCSKTDITCQVVNGGPVSAHKGINVPGVSLSLPFISERDSEDLAFGVEQGFDYVAASFTRSAYDIQQMRSLLKRLGGNHIRIIAKIENAEGVENIDSILQAADGVMVARGDLGVEIPLEEIPVIQKKLIDKTRAAGKQVVTATQMLDSMMHNPRPTRAESTDVANAIYDGTSAIMLSGETAAGEYPVQAVRTMARIAERTEADIDYKTLFIKRTADTYPNVTAAISHATVTTAHDLGARAIITVSKSGYTTRMISKNRPQCPIISGTPDPTVYRQTNLSWGVTPLMVNEMHSTDELFTHMVERARESGLVDDGDLVVITAGVPLGMSGTTNLMKVQMVGDVQVKGVGITKESAWGNLCVCHTEEQVKKKFHKGDILVVPFTNNNMLPEMRAASAIVTEAEGLDSHAAIVGLALNKPVIVGAEFATTILKNGASVTVDASRGIVYTGERKPE